MIYNLHVAHMYICMCVSIYICSLWTVCPCFYMISKTLEWHRFIHCICNFQTSYPLENDVLQKDMDVIYKQIGIIFNGFQKYFPLGT